MRLFILLLLFLALTTTTSTTTTSITYTVNVGNFTDGPADPTACSITSPPLPTCNLRSAWALCLARIRATICPSTATTPLALSCTVKLPAFSTSTIRGKVYGTVVNVTVALAPWAASCKYTTVKLSMVGSTATATAAVTGDQSSASLVVIQHLPFISVSLAHVNVSYFGNNVSNPAGAVALNNIYSASFSHVTFRHNVGNLTGGAVVVVSAVSTVAFIDCVFEGNSATYMGNNALSTYATGGALTVTSCAAGVTLLRCHFVNNNCLNGVTDGGVGGAACFYATNYVSIVNSSFIGNSVVGYYGQGGALVVENSIHVSLAQVTFENNSVVGDYGYGGALFMQSNTHVSLAQVAFDRSSVVGHRGNGGAFYMTSSTNVSLAQVAFTHSSVVGDNGGGGAVYIYSTTNVSLAQVAFGHNSVVGDNVAGGAFYLTQSTYISLAAVAFAGNSAGKTGSGGAIYMGQGVSYISIGGLLPIYETCLFCDAVPAGTIGSFDALVEASTARFLVTGYYVTVSRITSLPWCGEHAFVGNYKYGLTASCSPYSNTAVPGVDGVAPYSHDGSAVAVNFTRYNVDGNPYIALTLFPRAVRADGKGSAGCTFVGNSAGLSGGAIDVDRAASTIFIFDSSFAHNSAALGGAVTLNNTNSGIYFYGTSFTENQAASNGGAVALLKSNVAVQFHDCTFGANTASYGGALSMSYNNGFPVYATGVAIVLFNAAFSDNIATHDGGAIFTGSYNALHVTSSRFDHNSAGRQGGALFAAIAGHNDLQLSSTTFTANRAATGGGAVYVSDTNTLAVGSGTIFMSNHVDASGGAIALTCSTLLFGPGTVTFRNNSAGISGSAIWISSSSTSTVAFANATAPVLFTRNRCSTRGGTFYWIADAAAALINPDALHFASDNIAPVGPALATQATQLVSNHSIIHITSYDALLHPPPQLALIDYYGNINTTDYATVIAATVLPGYHCGSSGVGYLSGVSQVTATAGVATFNHLAAYCYPGGNMTVQFTAQLSGLDLAHKLTTQLQLKFRPCHDGEVLVTNQCELCPDGTYSFTYSPTATCNKCPDNADCTGGTVGVTPGHWRLSPRATTLLTCPWPKACIGSSERRRLATTGSDGCAPGYEGMLCGVCSATYFFASTTNTCEPCGSTAGGSQLGLMIVVPLLLLVAVLVAVYVSSRVSATAAEPTADIQIGRGRADSSLVSFASLQSSGKAVGAYVQTLMKDDELLMPLLKILTTVFQIVSTMPQATEVTFPPTASRLLNALAFVNFVSMNFGSPQCHVRYDYVDKLMAQTLAPIVVIALLFVGYIINRCRAVPIGRGVFVTCFFLITYLVLPGVTTTIFGTFSCVNVDPDGLVPGTPTYMHNDHSIACNSKRYAFGVTWASVMIVVYPVGILSLYLVFLYNNRDAIMAIKADEGDAKRQQETHDRSPGEDIPPATDIAGGATRRRHGRWRLLAPVQLATLRRVSWRVVGPAELTFLFAAYDGHVWYWEVVETTRRLLLTAVVSVVGIGSTGQIVFGILVALIYVKLYGYFQPYAQHELDIVQEIAQYQVFFTFFIALLIRDDRLPGDAWARALDALLVIANLSTITAAIVVYFHLHEVDVGVLAGRLRGRQGVPEGPTANDNNLSDVEAAAAPTPLVGHARRVHISGKEGDDDENSVLPFT